MGLDRRGSFHLKTSKKSYHCQPIVNPEGDFDPRRLFLYRRFVNLKRVVSLSLFHRIKHFSLFQNIWKPTASLPFVSLSASCQGGRNGVVDVWDGNWSRNCRARPLVGWRSEIPHRTWVFSVLPAVPRKKVNSPEQGFFHLVYGRAHKSNSRWKERSPFSNS